MRQTLVIIDAEKINDYNIPQLYFDENTIIIVYKDFISDLFRYVHMPRIFVLPEVIFESIMKGTFEITDYQIRADSHIIDNTSATIDGKPFFPADLIKLEVQEDYLNNYRKYIPEKTVASNLTGFVDAIEYLESIKVPVDNFTNLEMRLQRLSDFGDHKLATTLRSYYQKHIETFLDAASLSIQFNDLDSICFSPLQTDDPTLYYKLNNSTGVYSWNGYSTFIDTFTRVIFYTRVSNYITQFTKYFNKYKPVLVVYGILNYHIAQNIHEKTNKNIKFYDLLIKEVK